MDLSKIDINTTSKRKLSDAFDSGRLSHAVLLTGATKRIREVTAKQLCMAMLCESGGKKPCGKCRSCMLVKKDFHPDVTTVGLEEKKTSIPIDEIRRIKEKSFLVPHQSPFQVFIINDGESMREESQNALLKILEEPPATAKFILTCKDKSSLRETVLSRVETFSLSDDTGFTVGERENKSVTLAASLFTKALAEKREYDALIGIAPMIKDRKNFNSMCEKVVLILRDALVIDKNTPLISGEESISRDIRKAYCDEEIINIIQNVQKRAVQSTRNVSLSLVGSLIVAENFK